MSARELGLAGALARVEAGSLGLGAAAELMDVSYILTPDCSWCAKNAKAIGELARTVADRYDFAGLSLSGIDLPRHIAAAEYPFPVYFEVPLDVALGAEGRRNASDRTCVGRPSGPSFLEWGHIIGRVHSDVEAFFGVQLPELAESAN